MISLLIDFILVVLVALKSYNPSDESTILFGMSTSINGTNQHLGREFRTYVSVFFSITKKYQSGIIAAFEQFNVEGGILGGRFVNVTVINDHYSRDQCYNNTQIFVNNTEYFGLLGYLGSHTTSSIVNTVIYEDIPLIGTLSGSRFLRSNTSRASFDDELSAILTYVVRKHLKFKLSILYFNDTIGEDGYSAFIKAMYAYDLQPTSEVVFKAWQLENRDETGPLIESVLSGSPDALIMIGGPRLLATFLQQVQNGSYATASKSILFFTISYIGTREFANQLMTLNVDMSNKNIIVTQVVPHYDDTTYSQLTKNYVAALGLIGRRVTEKSFVSFEGYILGRFVVQALSTITGKLSRAKFFENIFQDTHIFYIDSFKIGPYESGSCNQGIRNIYPVTILSNVTFIPLVEAQYSWTDTCISRASLSEKSIVFKQSTVFTGPAQYYGISYTRGIQAAFLEYDRSLQPNQRLAVLDLLDDGYNPVLCEQNCRTFLSQNNTFALVGFLGTPTTARIKPLLMEHMHIPFIGAFTGADFLREDNMPNFINIRSGYPEEVSAIAQVFLNQGYTKFSCLYQNDSFGFSGLNALRSYLSVAGLKMESEGTYTTKSNDIEQAFEDIFHKNTPEVIVMVALSGQVAGFIKKMFDDSAPAVFKEVIIAGISVVAPTSLIAGLEGDYAKMKNVYLTSTVPYYNDTSYQMVRDFHEVVPVNDRGSIVFEGYIVGRFVTHVLSLFSKAEIDQITTKDYVDKIYQQSKFNFYDELWIGPYLRNDSKSVNETTVWCNSGLRKIYLTTINDKLGIDTFDTFEYSSCRADMNSLFTPVYFAFTSDYGDAKNKQITAGFLEAMEATKDNVREYVTEKKNLLLLSKDDAYNKDKRKQNVDILMSKNANAFIGMERIDAGLDLPVPIIGMTRPDVRTRRNKQYIHLRPFLHDEVGICLDFFKEQYSIRSRNIVLVVPRHESISTITENHRELIIVRINDDRIGDDYYETQGRFILSHDPSAIFWGVRSPTVSQILKKMHYEFTKQESKFMFLGLNDREDLIDRLFEMTFLYTTSVSKKRRIYHSYKTSMISKSGSSKYVDYGFYGYLIGVLVSANFVSAKQSGRNFGDNFFAQKTFNIENDINVGPFVEDECNIGLRTFYIYDNEDTEVYGEDLEKCTTYEEDKFPLEYLLIGSFGATVVCSVICVLCFAMVVVLVARSRLVNKVKPAYDGNCVVGFTDIQASSSLWRADRKAMGLALKVHNHVIRKAIKKFNGTEVKFIGDSFMILWEDVASAVNCCMYLQEKLMNSTWPPKILGLPDARAEVGSNGKLLFCGLRVRVALNYCERIHPVYDPTKKSYDYLSSGINKCARIEEVAKGGQICCPFDLIEMLLEHEEYDSRRTLMKRVGTYALKGCGECDVWEVFSKDLSERCHRYTQNKEKGESKASLITDGSSNSNTSASDTMNTMNLKLSSSAESSSSDALFSAADHQSEEEEEDLYVSKRNWALEKLEYVLKINNTNSFNSSDDDDDLVDVDDGERVGEETIVIVENKNNGNVELLN